VSIYRLFFSLALGMVLSGHGGHAQAHAIVIDSSPKAGSELMAAPFEIAIRFNSRIDIGRSSLVILDGDRNTTVLTVRPTTEPDLLQGLGPPLPAGRYRIRWQVLALDGHITRGDIPVTIKP
jgi:methionine-rich copper-binding protein CopC